ncbi:MAG: SDR family oxidoreductase [Nitrospirales bacterium]|nr:SDR family oxidoreductase [Nitrospira sp.]MDR4503105.1 SDR family oxidoreductase [Nitrospirales bacterium]
MNQPHSTLGQAVITGASRGIGAEYARALAGEGYSLLLVARNQARLEQVAGEISDAHAIEVRTACIDLTNDTASDELFETAQRSPLPVDLLINNAGFGMFGAFVQTPVAQVQAMLRLHINTIVESTHRFLPSMIARRKGTIINVASVAGFLPIPYMAEYAATKAFLISFSEALAEEVRASGVTIQACCPGSTQTDFHRTAGHQPKNPLGSQTVQEVVKASLNGLKKRHARVTVGWQGRAIDFLTHYMPRSLLVRMAGNRAKPTSQD